MLSVIGRVVRKISKNKKAEIIIHEQSGSTMCFQIREKEIPKLIIIDTGNIVRIEYRNDLSEKGEIRINNLILQTITPIS
ncbi:hypothetical protein [Flavicella sp.]|uniref:hypothetical protein n=1 Tax=Flavicella sp. TaxID=2957742 RepID=UPI0030197500